MSQETNDLVKLQEYIHKDMYSERDLFLGRVLTIIDASISDSQQRKGLKDIIREAMWRDSAWERSISYKLLAFADKHCKDLVPKTKEEENNFLYINKDCNERNSDHSPVYFG